MRRSLVAVCACALLLGACGGDRGGASGQTDRRELTVSAAASLTDAFDQIARAFQERNHGVTVLLNYGPSDGLARQIQEGAPVDVFASASPSWMDAVRDDGPGVTARADFARNELTLIVPRDDPAGVASIQDLADDGVRLVIAAEGVPAGDYARQVLANAGVADAALANVVSNAQDVRGVLTTVAAGEADAGIVYVTDVRTDAAADVETIPIPDDVNVIATYPIAVVEGSDEPDLARRFIDLVLGQGQQILRAHGFLPVE